MKFSRLWIVALFLTACSTGGPEFNLAQADQLIDYPIQKDRFAIVVILEEGVSESKARQMALQRAAELTVEGGNRYFTVESEEKVEVVKNEGSTPDQQKFNQNLFQEKIIENDFGRGSLERKSIATGIVPGIRYIIQSYPEKAGMKSYDACKYTNCK